MIKLCINLDSRPDRWELAQKEFEKVGLVVERMSAVIGDNRPLAFNQSVYKAMEMCRVKVIDEFKMLSASHDGNISGSIEKWHYEYEDLLLFEDDVVFDNITQYYFVKPDDALTIHLGCNIFGDWKMPQKHNENFAKLHNCWQSHATYYSQECVELILEKMNPNIIDEKNNIFDEWLRLNILPLGRSYVHVPMIAYQRPDHSDIWGHQTDYTECHIKGNEYLKKHCL